MCHQQVPWYRYRSRKVFCGCFQTRPKQHVRRHGAACMSGMGMQHDLRNRSLVGAFYFSLHPRKLISNNSPIDTHKQQVYSSFGLELARQHVVLLHATLLAALSNLAERSCPLTLRRWLARLSTRELHARRPRQPQPNGRARRFSTRSLVRRAHMYLCTI